MINCGQCRWWFIDKALESEISLGRCALYGHCNSLFPELKIRVPGDESTILMTRADFGCVQGEFKPAPER